MVPMQNNKIAFELEQAGNKHVFTIEQIIAFYLQKLHEFYVKDEVTTKDIVLTIPSYSSNTERQALVDAAEIAGLKCLRVINESTAICYNYGFFRKSDLSKEDERIVAFVDFGHSKTTVTVAGFKQQESRIICHRSDRNLGGRDMDYQIAQKLGEEFLAKFGEDPRTNPRCILRLYETIEKARKLLSGDTQANINIDYLLNEEDLNRVLKREEFETLIDPQIRQLTTLLRESIEASGKYYKQSIFGLQLRVVWGLDWFGGVLTCFKPSWFEAAYYSPYIQTVAFSAPRLSYSCYIKKELSRSLCSLRDTTKRRVAR